MTESDYKYTRLYEIIGQVANPVLLNVDVASGDRVLADRLKAEALVLRAWCHYLLVNFYAKAYNPATAETDPGIVYALETDDMAAPNEKLTV
ncbi:MAG: RagB/SusD family nutrient uptake outer membrane protein, partial [Butyricimonas faecihominis]